MPIDLKKNYIIFIVEFKIKWNGYIVHCMQNRTKSFDVFG